MSAIHLAKGTRKHGNLKGRLVSEVRFRAGSEHKKPWLSARVEAADQVVELKAFGDVAEKISGLQLHMGQVILADGYYPEQGTFVAEYLSCGEKNTAVVSADKQRQANLEAEAEARFRKRMAEEGRVRVQVAVDRFEQPVYSWKKKSEAVYYQGKWVDRMAFILDRYGAEKLDGELRQICGGMDGLGDYNKLKAALRHIDEVFEVVLKTAQVTPGLESRELEPVPADLPDECPF